MESADLKLQIPKLIEEANLYWARNEQNTAKHLMKNLITKLEKVILILSKLDNFCFKNSYDQVWKEFWFLSLKKCC